MLTRTKTAAMTTNQKVHGIIHTDATAAAAVGAGLAQLPGSDAQLLAGIHTTMIVAMAHEHGAPITKTAAADLLLTFTATHVGRGISQWLVGWVPGWGNAVNASTAAALTERSARQMRTAAMSWLRPKSERARERRSENTSCPAR